MFLRARRERGAAAVEFALILPLMILLLAGIIDFGRFFYTQNIVVNAAREGARMRVIGYTAAQADARVTQALIGVSGTPTVSYTYTSNANAVTNYTSASAAGTGNCPGSPLAGDRQKVLVSITGFNYIILGPAARLVGGSALTAPVPSGTAEFRCGG